MKSKDLKPGMEVAVGHADRCRKGVVLAEPGAFEWTRRSSWHSTAVRWRGPGLGNKKAVLVALERQPWDPCTWWSVEVMLSSSIHCTWEEWKARQAVIREREDMEGERQARRLEYRKRVGEDVSKLLGREVDIRHRDPSVEVLDDVLQALDPDRKLRGKRP